ncbi:hypothetical protein AABB24_007179, partial [Solanum stoloniferum]
NFLDMEFDLLLLSPMEAIAALLTLAFLFYFILSTKKTSKLPLPPEIAGGWPVIGHLFYFNNDGDNRPLARKLSDLADKYGPVFTFRVGLHRVLVISSYDAVKECYTKNDAVFANRPACLYGEYIGYNNAILFLANYGSYWRNIRKLIIQEVLSNSRLEKLKHIKIEKIRNDIKNLHSRIQNSEEKSVINLTDWLEKMNFGLIVKMIAGKNYESGGDEDEEVERFRETFKKFQVLSMEFMLWDAFPIRLFKWIDFQGHVKLMKKTFKDIDSISQRWLDEHVKRSKEDNGDGNYERDFIDVMLSKMSDERLHEGHSRDTTIKATVFVS